jgi:hypothetical protein
MRAHRAQSGHSGGGQPGQRGTSPPLTARLRP